MEEFVLEQDVNDVHDHDDIIDDNANPMIKQLLYLVEDKFVDTLPDNADELGYEIYVLVSAREGYYLQNILNYQIAGAICVPAGGDAFWRAVKLDENEQ